jgi:hypothetical protein
MLQNPQLCQVEDRRTQPEAGSISNLNVKPSCDQQNENPHLNLRNTGIQAFRLVSAGS